MIKRDDETHGNLTASARHIPAAPADWIDLSNPCVNRMNKSPVIPLTQPSKVSEFRGIVGHGAHDPVSGDLPHGIQKTAKNVKPNFSSISMAVDVELG